MDTKRKNPSGHGPMNNSGSSGRASSRPINALNLNDFFLSSPQTLAASGPMWCSNLRLVPQVEVNRRGKLASPRAALQPNYALDRDSVRRIPEPVQIGNAGPAGLSPILRQSGRKRRKAPRLGRLLHRIGIAENQAFGAASALTREVRRDILREAVFLCRTPLVTPRISSG